MAATLLACGGAALIAGAPDWLNHMALAQTPLTGSPDPTFSQDLSGLGHKFELIGTAADAADPRNPTNDVIATTIAEGGSSSDPQFAGAIRPLPPGVDIATLTDQLDLKYFFVDRTCGGGAPRFQLALDLDGDGVSDGNAFGYVGNPPNFTGCDLGRWRFEDLTDDVPRWDLSQFFAHGLTVPPGSGFVVPWSVAVAAVEAFPKHRVLSGALVDDTFPHSPSTAGSPGGVGHAFYDLVTVDNRTLDNRQDSVH